MRQFVKACDRLIVYSGGFSSPLVSLVRHADFVASARKYHTFGDLLWNQLCEWRSVITRFFDNQLYRSCLDNITSVTIEYSGPGTQSRQDGQLLNPCPALLMAGWLCSRLDWNPSACETSNDLLRYHLAAPSGRAVELILQPYGRSNPVAPTVESIRAKALCGDQQAYFGAERQGSTPVVNVIASVPGASDVNLSVKLVTSDLSTLLHKELDQGGLDSGYEAALGVAANLARFALNNRRT
jgi:glucose-6-phosphate dehydrogenase assembly protein OpcA